MANMIVYRLDTKIPLHEIEYLGYFASLDNVSTDVPSLANCFRSLDISDDATIEEAFERVRTLPDLDTDILEVIKNFDESIKNTKKHYQLFNELKKRGTFSTPPQDRTVTEYKDIICPFCEVHSIAVIPYKYSYCIKCPQCGDTHYVRKS